MKFLGEYRKMGSSDKLLWQKHRAVELVAQLPEDPDEALAILELAKQLIHEFVTTKGARRERDGRLTVV